MRGATAITIAPVGPVLNNGYDVGGARNYPWSNALGAGSPNAYFSRYIGPGNGNPIVPPVSALKGTTGWIGAGGTSSDADAMANPLHPGKSPLIWVAAFAALALAVMWHKGYKA